MIPPCVACLQVEPNACLARVLFNCTSRFAVVRIADLLQVNLDPAAASINAKQVVKGLEATAGRLEVQRMG